MEGGEIQTCCIESSVSSEVAIGIDKRSEESRGTNREKNKCGVNIGVENSIMEYEELAKVVEKAGPSIGEEREPNKTRGSNSNVEEKTTSVKCLVGNASLHVKDDAVKCAVDGTEQLGEIAVSVKSACLIIGKEEETGAKLTMKNATMDIEEKMHTGNGATETSTIDVEEETTSKSCVENAWANIEEKIAAKSSNMNAVIDMGEKNVIQRSNMFEEFGKSNMEEDATTIENSAENGMTCMKEGDSAIRSSIEIETLEEERYNTFEHSTESSRSNMEMENTATKVGAADERFNVKEKDSATKIVEGNAMYNTEETETATKIEEGNAMYDTEEKDSATKIVEGNAMYNTEEMETATKIEEGNAMYDTEEKDSATKIVEGNAMYNTEEMETATKIEEGKCMYKTQEMETATKSVAEEESSDNGKEKVISINYLENAGVIMKDKVMITTRTVECSEKNVDIQEEESGCPTVNSVRNDCSGNANELQFIETKRKAEDEELKKKFEDSSGVNLNPLSVRLDRCEMPMNGAMNVESKAERSHFWKERIRHRTIKLKKICTTTYPYIASKSRKHKSITKKSKIFIKLHDKILVTSNLYSLLKKAKSYVTGPLAKKIKFHDSCYWILSSDCTGQCQLPETILQKILHHRYCRAPKVFKNFHTFYEDYLSRKNIHFKNQPFSEQFLTEQPSLDDDRKQDVPLDEVIDDGPVYMDYIDPVTGDISGQISETNATIDNQNLVAPKSCEKEDSEKHMPQTSLQNLETDQESRQGGTEQEKESDVQLPFAPKSSENKEDEKHVAQTSLQNVETDQESGTELEKESNAQHPVAPKSIENEEDEKHVAQTSLQNVETDQESSQSGTELEKESDAQHPVAPKSSGNEEDEKHVAQTSLQNVETDQESGTELEKESSVHYQVATKSSENEEDEKRLAQTSLQNVEIDQENSQSGIELKFQNVDSSQDADGEKYQTGSDKLADLMSLISKGKNTDGQWRAKVRELCEREKSTMFHDLKINAEMSLKQALELKASLRLRENVMFKHENGDTEYLEACYIRPMKHLIICDMERSIHYALNNARYISVQVMKQFGKIMETWFQNVEKEILLVLEGVMRTLIDTLYNDNKETESEIKSWQDVRKVVDKIDGNIQQYCLKNRTLLAEEKLYQMAQKESVKQARVNKKETSLSKQCNKIESSVHNIVDFGEITQCDTARENDLECPVQDNVESVDKAQCNTVTKSGLEQSIQVELAYCKKPMKKERKTEKEKLTPEAVGFLRHKEEERQREINKKERLLSLWKHKLNELSMSIDCDCPDNKLRASSRQTPCVKHRIVSKLIHSCQIDSSDMSELRKKMGIILEDARFTESVKDTVKKVGIEYEFVKDLDRNIKKMKTYVREKEEEPEEFIKTLRTELLDEPSTEPMVKYLLKWNKDRTKTLRSSQQQSIGSSILNIASVVDNVEIIKERVTTASSKPSCPYLVVQSPVRIPAANSSGNQLAPQQINLVSGNQLSTQVSNQLSSSQNLSILGNQLAFLQNPLVPEKRQSSTHNPYASENQGSSTLPVVPSCVHPSVSHPQYRVNMSESVLQRQLRQPSIVVTNSANNTQKYVIVAQNHFSNRANISYQFNQSVGTGNLQQQPQVVINNFGAHAVRTEMMEQSMTMPQIAETLGSMEADLQPKILNVFSMKNSCEGDGNNYNCTAGLIPQSLEIKKALENKEGTEKEDCFCQDEEICVITSKDMTDALNAFGTDYTDYKTDSIKYGFGLLNSMQLQCAPARANKKNLDLRLSVHMVRAKVTDALIAEPLAITVEAVDLLCSQLHKIAQFRPWLVTIVNLVEVLTFVKTRTETFCNPELLANPVYKFGPNYACCQACEELFESRRLFEKHSALHKRSLESKLRIAEKERAFDFGNPSFCRFCKCFFTSEKSFIFHLKWACGTLNMNPAYSDNDTYKEAMDSSFIDLHHLYEEPPDFKQITRTRCHLCSVANEREDRIKKHFLYHAKLKEARLQCSECKILFSYNCHKFDEHCEIHLVAEIDSPFKCVFCKEVSFWFKASLYFHYRTHHKEQLIIPVTFTKAQAGIKGQEKCNITNVYESLVKAQNDLLSIDVCESKIVNDEVMQSRSRRKSGETDPAKASEIAEACPDGAALKPKVIKLEKDDTGGLTVVDDLKEMKKEYSDFRSEIEKRKMNLVTRKQVLLKELEQLRRERKNSALAKTGILTDVKKECPDKCDIDDEILGYRVEVNPDFTDDEDDDKTNEINETRDEDEFVEKYEEKNIKGITHHSQQTRILGFSLDKSVTGNEDKQVDSNQKPKGSLFEVITDPSYLSQIGSFDEVMSSMGQKRKRESRTCDGEVEEGGPKVQILDTPSSSSEGSKQPMLIKCQAGASVKQEKL